MKLYVADVAELADAQVSEACDGDIVEVQVLSSAPNIQEKASLTKARPFSFSKAREAGFDLVVA